jgi:hypothetical protein
VFSLVDSLWVIEMICFSIYTSIFFSLCTIDSSINRHLSHPHLIVSSPNIIILAPMVLMYNTSEILDTPKAGQNALLWSDTFLKLMHLRLHFTSSEILFEGSRDSIIFCWYRSEQIHVTIVWDSCAKLRPVNMTSLLSAKWLSARCHSGRMSINVSQLSLH